MDKEFYVPNPEHLAAQSSTNKLGREEVLDLEQAQEVLEILKKDAENAYKSYEYLLNEGENHNQDRFGIARELARMNLPVSFYTQFYWKIDLHNFLRFVKLRADTHAQYEIRVYAEIMLDILKKWVPFVYEAFIDYQKNAVTLSAKSIEVIKALISGKNISQSESGLSNREWLELMNILKN